MADSYQAEPTMADPLDGPGLSSADTQEPHAAELSKDPSAPTSQRPPPSDARKAFVKRTLNDVKAAKKHWKPDFDRMREDIYFAEGHHWDDGMPGLPDDRIVVDITARHIQLRTSALYAKNPTVVARRKESMDFQIWDENVTSLVLAQQRIAQGAQAGGDPSAVIDDILLLQDVAQGMQQREALDKFGKTLEIVFRDQIEHAQVPTFKGQVKDLIPRVLTTGVGYIKLDFQRLLGRAPSAENRLDDMRDRLAHMQTMLAEWEDDKDGDYAETRAAYDDLQTQMAAMQQEQQIILAEGLVFNFPDSTSIIPDKKCKSLVGFRGSDWVAEEFCMSPDDIRETWHVDVSGSYKKYQPWYDGQIIESTRASDNDPCMACVYVIYNKRTGLVYVVCDGYEDFLVEPATPQTRFQSFYPWFGLIFNRLESQRSPFPKSDVRLLKPMQLELNRTMEALRQHRIANQPKYVADASAFEEDEIVNMATYPPHEVIMLKAIAEGKDITKLIQALPKQALDPNIYSTEVIYESLLRVIGSQEANLGATSKGSTTATESSISEASRLSSQQSNADDLDDLLSLLAKNAGQVLVVEMNLQSIQKIAGRGAVWTQLRREELAAQLFLEVQAGSSGRPNQQQDLANIQKAMPFLLQIPGMSPQKLAEVILRATDPRLKPSDLMDPTITQSIQMMNRGGASPGAAAPQQDPSQDPAQQGAEGPQNSAPNTTPPPASAVAPDHSAQPFAPIAFAPLGLAA